MLGTKESAEQEKSRHRALLASIVEGLRAVVESDEQLLAFARGRLAGGWRGKLTIGPEAFFAPYVNIGLTDRRFLLQHIHPEDGKPSEILPHTFPLTEILSIHFAEIEMFGKDVAGRLAVHLNNEQHCRIRLQGAGNVENARALVEVFRSLTVAKRAATSPMQSICAHCGHILDQPSKFCPYCGGRRVEPEAASTSPATETAPPMETAVPEFAEAVPPMETASPVGPDFDALPEEPVTSNFSAPTEIENPPESVVDTVWTPAPLEEPAAPPDAEASTEAENSSAMTLEDPELADEMHRFTEEGGSPPAVEHDDDTPQEDGWPPSAAPQTSDASALSAPPSEHNPPPDAPPTNSYNTTF